MDLFTAVGVIILAFLGLVLVVFLLFILWMTHTYHIDITISSKREEDISYIGGQWSDGSHWNEGSQVNDSSS